MNLISVNGFDVGVVENVFGKAKVSANGSEKDAEFLDFTVFVKLSNNVFADGKLSLINDAKNADLYIKNCILLRAILERNLEKAKKENNEFEEKRLLSALEKNRLNYSYFVMLKKNKVRGGR